jgi:hypothetical protein
MVSRRDERGSLHALITHSQACLSRLLVLVLESCSPDIRKRTAFSAVDPAPSEFSAVLMQQFNPSNSSVSIKTALTE